VVWQKKYGKYFSFEISGLEKKLLHQANKADSPRSTTNGA
jgi:hypothetical protein